MKLRLNLKSTSGLINRIGFGGGTFSPLSLFKNGESGAWYDPSDLSTLFQDAAGTTPVTTAGVPVGLMLDKSGNGNQASQATSNARPTLMQDDDSQFYLQNDEIDDTLVTAFTDLGANCTVGYVTASEVHLLEDQSISGNYDLPSTDLYNIVIIDRALSLAEKVKLIRYLASKVKGVNYGAEIDRLTLIAINAVDVFVYDTSKDSDGGAWRTGALAQASSWYNETLNTAIRGARREFPAVAVIVAETYKVTIYDGDDPSLPMWMAINPTGGNVPHLWRTGRPVQSIAALNGQILVAIDLGEADASSGVVSYNFVADQASRRNSSVVYGFETISGRTLGTTLSALPGSIGIVDTRTNDVAMTVLPDAPSDPVTGLPVPTIAVATAGGVSVIKDDGTVVDSSLTTTIGTVDLFGGTLFWARHDFSNDVVYATTEIGSRSDGFGASFTIDKDSPAYLRPLTNNPDVIGLSDRHMAVGAAGVGLQNILLDTTEANSMVAYTTSTYNTGWMNGNIEGAFLSDADTASLVSEDFSIQTLTLGDFVIPTNNVVITDLGDRFRITRNAEAGTVVQARVDAAVASLAVGKPYFAEFEILATGPSNNAYTMANHGGGTGFISAAYTTGNTKRNQFSVATGDGTGGVRFEFSVSRGSNPSSSIEGDWIEIAKTLTVRRADADRSVNNKGLIVNGTITRTKVAPGADLVAYSGFSAANYLEQPYNSDLDFGTGDFCVMGWHKSTGSNNNADIFARTTLAPVVDDRIIRLTRWALGRYSFAVSRHGIGGDGVEYQAGNITHWAHIVCIRRSGTLELWIDGRLVASGPSATDASQPGAVFRLGHYVYSLNGSSALWRISATAPTADQIRRIYEDEKALFQENAACTLYGASDAVTALAHDPDTGLLHVGTSAGRSVFKGLERINNTTTSVSRAISASGGLVISK